LTISTIVGLMT